MLRGNCWQCRTDDGSGTDLTVSVIHDGSCGITAPGLRSRKKVIYNITVVFEGGKVSAGLHLMRRQHNARVWNQVAKQPAPSFFLVE
jgi:hypothetical protein